MSYLHQKLEDLFFVKWKSSFTHMYFSRNKGKSFWSFTWYYDSLFKLMKQHTHNTVVKMVEAQCHLQRYVIVSATSNVKYAKKISYYSYTLPQFFLNCLVI